jgi:proline iminopeptidase
MKEIINGCPLYYEIHGSAGASDTIFFIHGGPGLGDCRGDILTFKNLEEQYQLIFLDMRGSGRSADVPPYTHEQWIDDIDELRKKLGLEKIILHGASYGGFIVQEYALKYPENTKSIVLNVTAPDNEHHYKAIENALDSDKTGIEKEQLERLFHGKVRSNADFKALYKKILPLYAMKQDKEAQRKKLEQIYFHYETHNAAFHKNLKTFDLKNQLPELSIPALVVAGKHDWIISPEYSKNIADLIPKSVFVLFENYGHSLVREQGDCYISFINKFLDNELNEKEIVVDVP